MCKVAENSGKEGTSSWARKVRETPPYTRKPFAINSQGFLRIFTIFSSNISPPKRTWQCDLHLFQTTTVASRNSHKCTLSSSLTRQRRKTSRKSAETRVKSRRKFGLPRSCTHLHGSVYASQRRSSVLRALRAKSRQFNRANVARTRICDIKPTIDIGEPTSWETIRVSLTIWSRTWEAQPPFCELD